MAVSVLRTAARMSYKTDKGLLMISYEEQHTHNQAIALGRKVVLLGGGGGRG